MSDPPRKRARQACTSCNSRKIKCDVTITGIPCTNCQRDATLTCETVRRKIHRPRKSSLVVPPNSSSTLPNQSGPTPLLGEVDEVNDLPDDNSLSFLGDRRGPRNYVYEICMPNSPQDARQTPSRSQWTPSQLTFLCSENTFTPFNDGFTKTLIACYLEHMHFFFPVLDVRAFLDDTSKAEHRCWLLYWAVMLAGANFVGKEQMRSAGFSSRKDLKRTAYARAKVSLHAMTLIQCLYDLDLGSDKLVLIQATTLMSFWYSDAQEHTGAWYWIGCAISLAQTLGLHRGVQSTSHQTTRSEPLVRRIWWTLFIRDRWLSLAKGRPMRINEEDCDIAAPSPTDIVDELHQLPSPLASQYLPREYDLLADMWTSLVQTSVVLGRILKSHYGIQRRIPQDAVVDIARHHQELASFKPKATEGCPKHIQLHACHLELFYQMAVIVLYRPYVLEAILDDYSTNDAWTQARVAADCMSNILERIIRLDGVDLLKPMAITALVPAMQIHLYDCRAENPALRALGKNKLELYLLVLAQLQKTYWSANVIHRLFSRALVIVQDTTHTPPVFNSAAFEGVVTLSNPLASDQFDIDQLFAVDFDVDAWIQAEVPFPTEQPGNHDFTFW